MARTGRPRAFDRDEALRAAMNLFWTQGYEPTSLSQLKASMGGLSSASFYAAFESKEALFREVVALYLSTHGRATESLKDDTLQPREAIETALRRSVRLQASGVYPRGCLIAFGASNCALENAAVAELLAQARARDRRGVETHLERARAKGEFPAGFDISPLAAMYSTLLSGIATEARDGRGVEDLDAAISSAMQLWDAFRA